ncbi:hypothetical protein P154DRAFT_578991 [Amniculicola lignicola CBS 123094]|uniref:Uncharacterized protein n=1 Tax=Amniculicola lignicola CBS 123094 TaxID=1392246 RepID=A0A6A5W6J3_9PLEO|nr:hypothetical protein P154DRAFT_578991 [Amniculicola lignicola CBS 123094]
MNSENTASNEAATEDWRLESITVESVDIAAPSKHADRPRGKSLSHNAHPETPIGGGLDMRAKFVAKNTNIGWGVVHLYRDAKKTPDLYDGGYSSFAGGNTLTDEPVRTGTVNRYIILKEWNVEPFNSVNSDYVQVVFVQSITFQTGADFHHPSSFPDMADDPFISKTQPASILKMKSMGNFEEAIRKRPRGGA